MKLAVPDLITNSYFPAVAAAEHLVFHNLFDHIEATAPRLKTLAEIKSLAALMESMLKAHSDTRGRAVHRAAGALL